MATVAQSLANPVVTVRDLWVRYGNREAVRGVSLDLAPGEVLGLIGPDGAGKTSLLRVLAGLLPPTSGKVEVLGLPVWPHRRRLHTQIGYLPQRFSLYGDLSVDENLAFYGRLLGLPDWQTRRDILLSRLGLARFRQRLADQLSGGMKQKLALAVSLMHDPRLLLLDEPTTGVDPVSRRELWQLLAEFVAEGLTLVLSTPYLDEAERCSRVILMHRGRFLAQGAPRELRRRFPGAVWELAATPPHRVAQVLADRGASVQPFGTRYHVYFRPQAPIPSQEELVQQGLHVTQWRPLTPTLEDFFLYLVTEEGREP